MKLSIYIAVLYIFIISSSNVLAVPAVIKSQRSKKTISRIPNLEFLMNLFEKSGFPIITQLGQVMRALQTYDDTSGLTNFSVYPCSMAGLKSFFTERVTSTKFHSIGNRGFSGSGDPVDRCKEMKKMYDLYSPVYDLMNQFLRDESSNKDNTYHLKAGKYSKLFDHLKNVSNDQFTGKHFLLMRKE